MELVRIFLPFAGVALAPLVPVPYALLMLRRGWRPTVLAVMVGALLVGLITGLHYGWRMAVSGLVGLALGFAMRMHLRPALVVLAGSVLTSIGTYAFFFAVFFVLGVPLADFVTGMQNGFHAINSAAEWLASQLDLTALWQQVVPSLLAFEAWMMRYWLLAVYGVVLCWSIGAVMLYYMVSNKLMRFFGFEVRPFPSPRVERAIRWLVRHMQKLVRLLHYRRLRRRASAVSTTELES